MLGKGDINQGNCGHLVLLWSDNIIVLHCEYIYNKYKLVYNIIIIIHEPIKYHEICILTHAQ